MQFLNCNFSTMYIYLYIIHTYISMYIYNFALFWLTGLFFFYVSFNDFDLCLSIMFMLVCKPFLSFGKALYCHKSSCALFDRL